MGVTDLIVKLFITATFADSRIIAKYCIDSLATAVILIHNHPSGKMNPVWQIEKLQIK